MNNNWQFQKLEELCDFYNGLWEGKKKPFKTVGVIRNTNFSKDWKLDDSNIAYLEVEGNQFQTRKLQFGDLILEKSGGGPKQPVGRVIIFDKQEGDYSFSNFTSVMRVKDKNRIDFRFLQKFLYLCYLNGMTAKMQKHSTGIRNLKLKEYREIIVPIPPLPEQQRIVDILDQSFAAIDQVIENTNINIINLDNFTKSYLTSILKNNQDGNWIQKKIKSITTKIGSGATPIGGKNSYQKKGISLIRSLNVYDDGFQYKNLAFIDEKQAQKLSSVEIEKRDILLNITGASILRCCVVPEDVLPARVNQHVLILRPVENIILPEFVHLLIISADYKSSLLQIAKAGGSTREALTKEGISNFKISFPKEISKQEKLVNLYNSFVAQSDKLRNNYYQKIEKLQELKQSIIHKAFTGEL